MNSVLAFFTGVILILIVIFIFGIASNYNSNIWSLWNSIFGIKDPSI